jgi:hypothetical protein
MSEALGHRARGQRAKLAQRADAEPLEHLGQRLELGPGAKQRDGKRCEEVAHGRLHHHMRVPPSPGANLQRRGVRREAARAGAEASSRPERPAGGAEDSGQVAAVDSMKPGGGEEGGAGVIRLHLGSDPLEAVQHRAPQRADPLGIGRHEP